MMQTFAATSTKKPPAFSQARPSGLGGVVLQRKCECGQHAADGECEECKKKKPEEKSNQDPLLQRSAMNRSTVTEVPPIVHEVLRSQGQPLDAVARAYFELRFGQDFSRVRVHDGPQAAASARAVEAKAYTVGNNLVFASHSYRPDTTAGKKLLAHELTHVMQQSSTSASWESRPGGLELGKADDKFEQEAAKNENLIDETLQPTGNQAASRFRSHAWQPGHSKLSMAERVQRDLEDPSRFSTIHESLFVSTPGGGAPQPWKDPAPGEEGTAVKIKREFKATFQAFLKANPMATGGDIPTETSKADIDTDVVQADKVIRTRFPQISSPISESNLKAAVNVISDQQTSDPDYLKQFLTNKLYSFRVLDDYAVQESDPRFQKMLEELLADPDIGSSIKILASRVSAYTTGEGAARKVALNRGLDAKRRMESLLHEMVHFYVHPTFKDWINQSTAPRSYDEGFTEYLSRLALTKDQLADAKGYKDSFDLVKDKIAKNASDDDIARAYFRGEVWLLEGKTDVAKKALEEQAGLKSKVTPKEEREESKTSEGIAETVVPGSHYRFMNLGNEEFEPKREHKALFREIQNKYLNGHPDVACRFVGFASSPGTEAFNMALSLKRAQTFYQMARDEGVPDAQLVDADKPPHFGEQKPTAPNEDVRGRAFNRRVELYLVPIQPAGSAIQQAPAPRGEHSLYRTNVPLQEVLQSPGQPLDAATRRQFEPRFGKDFSNVRVHADSRAAASARSMNALAYASGGHLAFAPGQYDPASLRGQQLLAHELTHVAQQSHVPSKDASATERSERQATENARSFAQPGFLPSFEPAARNAVLRQGTGSSGTQPQAPDDELVLGQKLVSDFPSGVNVAFYADPEPAEAQRRASDWATRENAIGPNKSTITAKELTFGKAISDKLGLAATLKSMAGVLSAAVKKALAASGQVLPELWPAKVRNLGLFSHGTSDWCGLGTGITSVNAKTVVKSIAPTLASDVNVLLFACNTGRGSSEDEDWIKGTTQPGGVGSLASVTRDALADEGLKSATVWGHTTTGHVSGNPALREFSADDGKGQPGSAYLTKYVFTGPQQVTALIEMQGAVLSKGFAVPDPKQFGAAAGQEIIAAMYACYIEANSKLDFKGGKLAESAPTHPTEVAEEINKYWSKYWPDHVDKAADRLIKRLKLKKETK